MEPEHASSDERIASLNALIHELDQQLSAFQDLREDAARALREALGDPGRREAGGDG